MPLPSIALLLAAAVFHALANTLIKQARDKLAFTWWMLGASSVLGAPILFLMQSADLHGWPIVVASGALEAVYFVALTRAYALGDLSQVYPMARGSAPLFTLLWAALFLHERPSALGVTGILSIVLGLYVINLPAPADWKRPLQSFKHPAARWALATGLLISAYSTVDKRGVEYFDPIVYLYLILLVGWLALSPQWLSADRRAALWGEVRPEVSAALRSTLPLPVRRRWSRLINVALCAALGNAAYVLVLAALRLSPVSYVGPTREVSVVIGTWIGVRFLGERGGAFRIMAAGLVVAGILLIAFGG